MIVFEKKHLVGRFLRMARVEEFLSIFLVGLRFIAIFSAIKLSRTSSSSKVAGERGAVMSPLTLSSRACLSQWTTSITHLLRCQCKYSELGTRRDQAHCRRNSIGSFEGHPRTAQR